ncbi:MAG: glycine oxidase ThiO [Commensalibacter sp.]|nr:glycine oxidase ThiO [Commensalibacter sp.]
MTIRIIGAGVAGLTAATELADRGYSIALFEEGSRIGEKSCSWFAGGMLAPWCERESAEEVVITRGIQALNWWPRFFKPTVMKGTLLVAAPRDVPELLRFSKRTSGYEWVDEARIAQLEPDLQGRFFKGLFFPKEGHLNPRQALPTLCQNLLDKGAEIHLNTKADPIPKDKDDVVIDCRGLYARHDLPTIRGVRGEMLLVRTHEVQLSRPVRLLHPRIPLYIVPRGEGIFMIGATMIESDYKGEGKVRSVVELLNGAYAIHPAFGEADILEIGCDVRPAFPDNLPQVIKKSANHYYVNGMHRHGFLLTPWLASQLAEQIAKDRK